MASLLLILLVLQDPATQQDVLKLARDGAKDEVLLEKIGKATFKLSPDDVVALKKAGVSDAVLSRMITGPSEIKAVNLSHKDVRIVVQDKTLDVRFASGHEIARGKTVDLPAAGTFTVTVQGRTTAQKVRTPATLTFRGADLSGFEVLTLLVEDADGKRTIMLQTRDKDPANTRARAAYRRGPPPGSGRIMRGGLFDRVVDGVTGSIGAVADFLTGY